MKRTLLLLALLATPALAQGVTLPCGSGATQLTSGLTVTTYIDTTPVDGATYSYVVTAIDLGGQTCSNIVGSTVIPATGTHTVTLNWVASATSGVTYSVFRASPPTAPSSLTTTVN